MDMNGGRRRIPLVEEPKRPPWMLIILLVAAAVVILWGISNIRIIIGEDAEKVHTLSPDAEVMGEAGEQEELIEVRPASPDAVADPAAPPLVRLETETPRWSRRPLPDYPSIRTETPSQASVTISCIVQSDRGLGDCIVLSEEPSGYGFGEETIRAARRARVADEMRPGVRVMYTTRFVMPD